MGDAHAAVAFSFSITHEGVNINYDWEVLNLVWKSGLRSWKKRCSRFMTNLWNGVYPASPYSLLIIITLVSALQFAGKDVSFGAIQHISRWILSENSYPSINLLISCGIYGFLLWMVMIYFLRYCLKLLFMYKGWLQDARLRKSSSKTKVWAILVKILMGNKPPGLYSFQSSLPRLPLPSLEDTMSRYLKSVKPLLDEEQYQRMEKLTTEFKNGIGKKLQKYLWLKSWWASNYVSDWWEEYVYLRGRSPLLVNSNCYGLDSLAHPTKVQTARAANFIYGSLVFRKNITNQTMKPIMIQDFIPLCSWQYERIFNTVRVPGIETDKVVHLSDSQHIIVYSKGCYYKMPVYHKDRLLMPAELQEQLDMILKSNNTPHEGEEHLAALTALDRVSWAKAREKFFAKGINKASLKAIESAAFNVVLGEEDLDIDQNDPTKLDKLSQTTLHGKGYDIWLDKSFTIIVAKNGRLGCNAEHSWCDAPIMAHMWEFCLAMEAIDMKYKEDGNTCGTVEMPPPSPVHLKWDLQPECINLVKNAVLSARAILEDVDLKVFFHNGYGKGFIKKCNLSPDAYTQMVLQLAYYRDAGKFNLTYEASMTRLFREGRTETVRPVTEESCAFVRAMEDPICPKSKKVELLRKACSVHQAGYINAMCGKGIDRHLFCLYVVSKYLEVESPFLKEVLGEPWRLSTSQTPQRQTSLIDLKRFPNIICTGGGFGPVADDGYGVSYIHGGEDFMILHVSSKRSSPETDTLRFIRRIKRALVDIKELFNEEIVQNGTKTSH